MTGEKVEERQEENLTRQKMEFFLPYNNWLVITRREKNVAGVPCPGPENSQGKIRDEAHAKYV